MRFVMTTLLAISLLALPAMAGSDCEKCSCDEPVSECLNTMVTKLKTSGFIGVELDEDKATKALTVTNVIPGSPAETAGIRAGDELYALNGIRFKDQNHEAMSKVKVPGNEVTCTIKRNGASKEIQMTLVPMPADLMAKYIGEHMMAHAKQTDAEKEG
jgi:C-terminal processing protease CtpA/Prc